MNKATFPEFTLAKTFCTYPAKEFHCIMVYSVNKLLSATGIWEAKRLSEK